MTFYLWRLMWMFLQHEQLKAIDEKRMIWIRVRKSVYGSKDPDLSHNVTDSEHWSIIRACIWEVVPKNLVFNLNILHEQMFHAVHHPLHRADHAGRRGFHRCLSYLNLRVPINYRTSFLLVSLFLSNYLKNKFLLWNWI